MGSSPENSSWPWILPSSPTCAHHGGFSHRPGGWEQIHAEGYRTHRAVSPSPFPCPPFCLPHKSHSIELIIYLSSLVSFLFKLEMAILKKNRAAELIHVNPVSWSDLKTLGSEEVEKQELQLGHLCPTENAPDSGPPREWGEDCRKGWEPVLLDKVR